MGFPQDFDLSDEDEQTWEQIHAELVAAEEAKQQQQPEEEEQTTTEGEGEDDGSE